MHIGFTATADWHFAIKVEALLLSDAKAKRLGVVNTNDIRKIRLRMIRISYTL